MGKGAGCIGSKGLLSKKKAPTENAGGGPSTTTAAAPATATTPNTQEQQQEEEEAKTNNSDLQLEEEKPVASPTTAPPTEEVAASLNPTTHKVRLFIVYYSMYDHVLSLAKKVKEGADSVEGVEAVLYQVPETLSPEVLEKMSAPAKDNSIPIISPAELADADGIIFGFPTRYGSMSAQMKAFFDSTGALWRTQALAGKPAGIFISTGSQGGGQETTAWTAITQLTHHGMLFVPIGYTFGADMFSLEQPRGGTPYGAGTFAGDGTKTPTDTELALAEHQGRYTADIVKKLVSNN
ncbi:unnamed protein product [Sphagnum balticum]